MGNSPRTCRPLFSTDNVETLSVLLVTQALNDVMTVIAGQALMVPLQLLFFFYLSLSLFSLARPRSLFYTGTQTQGESRTRTRLIARRTRRHAHSAVAQLKEDLFPLRWPPRNLHLPAPFLPAHPPSSISLLLSHISLYLTLLFHRGSGLRRGYPVRISLLCPT